MTTPLPHLHRLITAAFDENDLRTLAFGLGIPYDALPGQGTAAGARELILYLGRRRRFDELLAVLCRERPGALEDQCRTLQEIIEGLDTELAWIDQTIEQCRAQTE